MTSRVFTKFQYGKESTRGTAVAATKMLLAAPKAIPQDRTPRFVEDALGVRAHAVRAAIDQILAEDTLSIPDAYFQCLPMLFSCGLKGNITATETTGGQGDYLWTFLPSMTAANAPDTITLEMGDDTQAYEIEYLFFKRYKIALQVAQGAEASPVSIEADYTGRQVSTSTFTGAISVPTVTTMNGKLARLYKDAAWTNRGTTELTNVLRGAELEIITGVHHKFFGDGNQYFATHGESYIDAMLTLDLERSAAADTLWDEMRALTAKAYSLKINGPQIGTGSTYNLTVNLWGMPEQAVPLNAEDRGNNIDRFLIHGMYDTTGAQILEVKVTTNASTM